MARRGSFNTAADYVPRVPLWRFLHEGLGAAYHPSPFPHGRLVNVTGNVSSSWAQVTCLECQVISVHSLTQVTHASSAITPLSKGN